MKKVVLASVLLIAMAMPAQAVIVDPLVGLTDFVFSFTGDLGAALGDNVSWAGDPTLDLTLAGAMSFDVHTEDCCVVGDEWDLVVNGALVPWMIVTAGDGSPNGSASIGAPGPYYEALTTIVLPVGSHTIDMHQTAGIPGGSWFNLSAGTSVVPEPASLTLLGAGLFALGWGRRRRRR